jgi:hypothetical protein
MLGIGGSSLAHNARELVKIVPTKTIVLIFFIRNNSSLIRRDQKISS